MNLWQESPKVFRKKETPKCWVLCVYHTWINAVSSYMVHKDIKTTFPIYYSTQCIYGRVMHSMAHVDIRRQLVGISSPFHHVHPKVRLRASGLASSIFTHKAISPAIPVHRYILQC